MNCADSVRVAFPLFPEEGGGSSPTSALQLRVVKIDFDSACKLNRQWHSRLPRTGFMKSVPYLCFAAEFKWVYFAIAIWSNPVARLLPQDTWLELRRLAVAPDAPRNTCSRMLRIMTAMIKREKPEIKRLVSYHDTEVHNGSIYKAAGWIPTIISEGDEWDRPSRRRKKVQSNAKKQRWEKCIRS